jgi:hypothetical protein
MPMSITSSETLSSVRPKLEYRWRTRASAVARVEHDLQEDRRAAERERGPAAASGPARPAPGHQRARQRADHGVGDGDLVGRQAGAGEPRRQPQRHRPDHVGVAEAVVAAPARLQERALGPPPRPPVGDRHPGDHVASHRPRVGRGVAVGELDRQRQGRQRRPGRRGQPHQRPGRAGLGRLAQHPLDDRHAAQPHRGHGLAPGVVDEHRGHRRVMPQPRDRSKRARAGPRDPLSSPAVKAIILAAGMGSRLAPLTNDRPKVLVPVAGRPILFRQLDHLTAAGFDLADVVIVGGYRVDTLRAELAANGFAACTVIFNDMRAVEQLLVAGGGRPAVRGHAVLQFGSDVILDPRSCRRCWRRPATRCSRSTCATSSTTRP